MPLLQSAQIRAALTSDPSSVPLRMALAKSLVDAVWRDYSSEIFAANYDEARSIYESILIAYPKDPVALVSLGTVLSDQGHHRQAMQQYQLAQELGWRDANLDYNIGVALINLSERERGKAYFEASLKKASHESTWQAYFDPQAQ